MARPPGSHRTPALWRERVFGVRWPGLRRVAKKLVYTARAPIPIWEGRRAPFLTL